MPDRFHLALDCIVAALASIVTIAASMTPSPPDMVAAIGAMLATVIAVLEARKKDRSLGNTVGVILGSAVTGSVTPGIVLWNFFPSIAERLTWHAWAGSGFIVGLCGWALVLAILGAIQRRKDILAEQIVDRYIPKPKDQ